MPGVSQSEKGFAPLDDSAELIKAGGAIMLAEKGEKNNMFLRKKWIIRAVAHCCEGK